MNWFVFYTLPKQEKKVYQRLINQGLDAYLPLRKTIKQWSDRKKKVQEPLFTSYIFIRTNENGRQVALKTYGVVKCIYTQDKPAIVRNEEIEAIKAFIGHTANWPTENIQTFNKGDLLDIKSGILKGKKGRFIYQHKQDIILLVESLGHLVHAHLPAHHLVA